MVLRVLVQTLTGSFETVLRRSVTRRRALESCSAGVTKLFALNAVLLGQTLFGLQFTSRVVRRPPGQGPDTSFLGRRSVDPYRLPEHVVPTRYDLRLEPDFTTFTFTGRETITLSISEVTAELVLNAAELDITEATIIHEQGPSHRGTVELEEATERCRIRFPTSLPPGTWTLSLSFTGTLNDKLRGFYRSSYKDQAGESRLLAATQFEATDARRAFPCWDEPGFKAEFAVTLAIDPAMTAVSNGPVVSARLEGGKKVVRFADTIRMSTYLVAFVIGPLEATDPVDVGGTPLRIWCVPGKRHLAAFGQAIAAFSLKFFQDYYGLPYPGRKLDLLAIPDFAAGAMENLGAITFRETALLVDQPAASHAELERIADVVAHENAHMWFGDLVTMSWWNGLWLNEAFATFMEVLAVDAWKPDWQRWTTFGVSRAEALTVDGLHSTRPIEYPVRAPKDADAMFDVLTYEKGGSVLRMLEQHLGATVFRDGVRLYLRKHAYANADTGDLWAAIGEAARQPVPALMNNWIFQEGHPLIIVTLDQAPGKAPALVLTQQRFTYLPDPLPAVQLPEPARADAAEQKRKHRREEPWQVPLQIRITARGTSHTQRALLTDSKLRIELPDGFESALVNEGGHGFYRVRYASDLLERLLQHLPEGTAPIERFNLVNDAWAAAQAGHMPLPEYLELTGRFRAERDKNVWAILIESLHELNRIITSDERPAFEALVRDRLTPAFAELGWSARSGETDLTRQLRGELLRALGTIGNDAALQQQAAALFEQHVRAAGNGSRDPASQAADPNVLPALIAILAFVGDQTRYEDFLQRYRKAATPQEERRYLYALAGFRQPSLLEQTLARTLNGETRTQDAPFMIRLVLTNIYGRELAWDFVKSHWEAMDRQFPKNGLRRMCGGVMGLATPELERDVQEFFMVRKIDLGGKTLEQYLEQLHIAVTMREREGAALAQYLKRVL